MAFLIDKNTIVLVQGITGKEGQRAVEWMLAAGTRVAAGVTPGKGGQEVQGVPVFDSVSEAVTQFPGINATSIYAPPRFVKAAVFEAMNSNIGLVHVFAENVPVLDTLQMIEAARRDGIRLLGPSSVGAFSPGQARLGSAGGGDESQFLAPHQDQKGVAIISKSGGMIPTMANPLTRAGIPQTTVVGIGGDRLVGTTYADLLAAIETDDQTEAVLIIGEIGGAYEELLAEEIIKTKFSKKVVALITGVFAETLPQGVAFGHAGAIVSKTEGTRAGKIAALRKAGVHVAESPLEIIRLLQS